MKPVDVTTGIDIDRPRRMVAAYVADPDHAPDWYANIDQIMWVTEKPLTVSTPVVAAAMRRANRKDLAALKSLLERR
jgi:hypothetical protein